MKSKNRESFNDLYKWNVKDLYNDEKEFLKELDRLKIDIEEIKKYKDNFLDSADNLLKLLNLESELSKRIERAYIYGHINNDSDTTNTHYQELFGKIKNIYSTFVQYTSFIVPELLKLDYSIIEKYLKENKELLKYERTLKNIFRYKNHTLRSDIEEVLSTYINVFSINEDVMDSLTDSDFKYGNIIVDKKEVELTQSNYGMYVRHNDRKVRESAFTKLHEKFGEFKNTLTVTLKGEVEKNSINAKLRNYKNSLNASLFKNEIDEEVYFNLINSVHKNLKYLYRYWNLKKKVLNVDELHIYDTYADLKKENNSEYSYEDAKKLITESLKLLGPNYIDILNKAFNEGWIDSCNNTGKRGGAYCTTCYSVHPYVLLSYEKTLNDISTLAHELGHAMHYYYAQTNQSYEDYGYSIFVAEVASQVNELLLSRYLLDNIKNKDEKIKIIDDLLQKFKSTIFRQTMFAEFEKDIHEYVENGNILTNDVLCSKYYDLNKLYYGDNVYVDDLVKYECFRIPHFYMNFYVYQYATGFACAVYIANKIYENDLVLRDKYLEFLKLGCTKNPLDSLKVVGIDMKEEYVMDDAIKYMNELIDEYEKLLGSDENE